MPQGDGKDWADRAALEVTREVIAERWAISVERIEVFTDEIATILLRHGVAKPNRDYNERTGEWE